MTQTLVEMATVFVVARIHAGPCPPDVINQILHTTHATLFDLSRQEATQKIKRQKGAMPPETLASLRQRPWETFQRSQVICLECGKAHRLLSSRHLVLHGLTAKAYKKKWGIPLGRPLSAQSLTQRRRQKARERDAGQYLAAWRAQRRRQTA
jgi:predicted transcriptional regulator